MTHWNIYASAKYHRKALPERALPKKRRLQS
jgi:hypothetical protein